VFENTPAPLTPLLAQNSAHKILKPPQDYTIATALLCVFGQPAKNFIGFLNFYENL
jgi:hypothetical protein